MYAAAIVAVVILLPIGFLAYVGYLGGAVFTVLPAEGRAPRSQQGVTALFLSSDMGLRLGMGSQIVRRLSDDAVPGGRDQQPHLFPRGPHAGRCRCTAGRGYRPAPGGSRALAGWCSSASLSAPTCCRPRSRGCRRAYRRGIAMVVLIVPPDTTMYRASPAEIFDFGQAGTAALPTARRLDWVPVLCIQGVEEADSLCPHMTAANVVRVALPGGHMLGFDADRLYAAIAPPLRRAIAARPIAQHYR